MKNTSNRWIVLKFGGTSVSSLSCWQTIAQVIKDRQKEGLRPIVVCSAVAGVSNLIEKLLDEAKAGQHENTLSAITDKHHKLADELGIDRTEIDPYSEKLSNLLKGIALVGEVSPKSHAKAMAYGELMSTRLGSIYLNSNGVPTTWHDARDLLLAEDVKDTSIQRSYLHACCSFQTDDSMTEKLAVEKDSAILTQGFIARNRNGDTVLLGRGGSDVSAAYLAAKVDAVRCEIWTDVPGMFTANPHKVPNARLIKVLDYDEAQEIATAGARVLHPRCLTPLSTHGIPLNICCMQEPDLKGTTVTSELDDTGAQVKAISSKLGVTLVSMETIDMWHQVGFLADAFSCFKKHGLSIDLISTSETNVSVTLDRSTNVLDQQTLSALSRDLEEICKVNIIDDCAFVSLVGRNIRGILHQLGDALQVFEEQKIYLVSQAANDLNFTFVVDEGQAERLVTSLHGEIFAHRTNDKLLGQTWKEMFDRSEPKTAKRKTPWWEERSDELIELARSKSPLYVYDEATVDQAISNLSKLEAVDKIFYSIKANPYQDILRKVHDAGLNFECVSLAEVEHVRNTFPKIDPSRILFTPNFAGRGEYERALNYGVTVTLDNLFPLQAWPELFSGKEVFVRMDPGRGRGHHKYVHTAGTKSKFGVPSTQVDEFKRLAASCGAKVVGLHAHVGSNIFSTDTWSEAALYLAKVAERFPEVKHLDLGGGLGVVEKAGQDELDIKSVDERLRQFKMANPKYELWMEPGRYIAAEAGVLLGRVTQTKKKGEYYYVGIDAGMNTLIRPALYGSHHEIVNLSKLGDESNVVANVVGPICESGDILGYARQLAEPQEGDVILIATTGAYGKVMSSNYNLREPAAEHFLKFNK